MRRKLIKRITMQHYIPGAEEAECGGVYYVTPGDGPNDCIWWDDILYGDYSKPYVFVYKDSVEVQRINPRYVLSIEWEEDGGGE
jgi:hypothetical protein